MSDPDRGTDPETEVRYDNWPLERRDEYADWTVERANARQERDPSEGVADEYRDELVDDELEWIGFVGGHQGGAPHLYSPADSAVYEGELDEENERIVLREADRHEVDEESLGEHIEEIGEDHGWEWLSSFARTYLEDDDPERGSFDLRESEFQQRNVGETDRHDVAFFGSHTFDDESGRIHVIERYFDVFLDEDPSGDVSGVDRAEVKEEYLIAEAPAEERRAGDAEMADENRREIDVNVDVGEFGWEEVLEERLEEWHDERVGWQRRE